VSYDVSVFLHLSEKLNAKWRLEANTDEVTLQEHLLLKKTIKNALGDVDWQVFMEMLHQTRWLDEISEFVWWLGLEFDSLGLKVRVSLTYRMTFISSGQLLLQIE
jgi:hypothetical protein